MSLTIYSICRYCEVFKYKFKNVYLYNAQTSNKLQGRFYLGLRPAIVSHWLGASLESALFGRLYEVTTAICPFCHFCSVIQLPDYNVYLFFVSILLRNTSLLYWTSVCKMIVFHKSWIWE